MIVVVILKKIFLFSFDRERVCGLKGDLFWMIVVLKLGD